MLASEYLFGKCSSWCLYFWAGTGLQWHQIGLFFPSLCLPSACHHTWWFQSWFVPLSPHSAGSKEDHDKWLTVFLLPSALKDVVGCSMSRNPCQTCESPLDHFPPWSRRRNCSCVCVCVWERETDRQTDRKKNMCMCSVASVVSNSATLSSVL